MTAVMNPTTTSETFFTAAYDHSAPASISFDRCVDWLLDLHQATADENLKALVAEVLDELRGLAVIDEIEVEDLVLGALASVEVAFEIAEGR